MKVCNGGPRRYKLVLFNDLLVYGTETMRVKLLMDNRRKYRQHQGIHLQECLVLDYDSSVAFVISCHGKKSFVVVATSAGEKQVEYNTLECTVFSAGSSRLLLFLRHDDDNHDDYIPWMKEQ